MNLVQLIMKVFNWARNLMNEYRIQEHGSNENINFHSSRLALAMFKQHKPDVRYFQ